MVSVYSPSVGFEYFREEWSGTRKRREERPVRYLAALPERRREGGGYFCTAATTKPLVHGVDRNGLSKDGEGCSILSKCIPTSIFEDSDSKFLFIKLSGVLNADALELESISIALKE